MAFLQQSLKWGCSSCSAALPLGWGYFAAALRREMFLQRSGGGADLTSSEEPKVL